MSSLRGNPTLTSSITVRQRWQVVIWSLWPGIKHHYLSPMAECLHRHLPTAILLVRLQHHGAGWYRVPPTPAAIHLWRRLGVHVLEDDFVRIERGSVTMKAYEDSYVCDFWPIEE